MKYATLIFVAAALAQLPSVSGKYTWGQDALTVTQLDGSSVQYLINPRTMEAFQADPNAALGSLWEWANQYHPELIPTIEARIQSAGNDDAAQLVYNRLRSLGSTPETDGVVWQAVERLRQ